MTTLDGPAAQLGIGVVVPYDMALDRELWRWTPGHVSLHVTRTPFAALPVGVAMAEHVADVRAVRTAVTDLRAVAPDVFVYACTSGSFVRGPDGERALTEGMRAAGGRPAVTTSGALLAALARLGVSRVGVATPYDEAVSGRFAAFLAAAGVQVVSQARLDLDREIWRVPYARTAELVREADDDLAQAVVVACTNLPTYDLIAPLEAELGKPVITACLATMWAALAAVGARPVGPGQRLSLLPPVCQGTRRDHGAHCGRRRTTMSGVRPYTVGLLYPGHAAEDDFAWLEARLDGVRLPVVRTSVGTDAHEVGALLDLGGPDRLAAGAQTLEPLHPDSVMWACTSGSFVFGWEGARRQADALSDLVGRPASSTSIAFAEALAFLGLARVSIAASYPQDVARRFAAFLARAGVDVVHLGSHGIYTAAEVGTLRRDEVVAMVSTAARSGVEAVLVPDTAMHTLPWLAELEAAAGTRVLTANQVTVWEGLRIAGGPPAGQALGALWGT